MPQGIRFSELAIIDYDEAYASVTAAKSAATEVCNLRCKPGKQPWLLSLARSVDAAGVALVSFRLEVNRSMLYPFHTNLNQWAAPEEQLQLPVCVPIAQLSEVRIVAYSADPSNTYSATGRFRIGYTDFERSSVMI